MQYLFSKESGNEIIKLENEDFKYIAKVRRKKVGDFIAFRNLEDDNLYYYKIIAINKKDLVCTLDFKEEKQVLPKKELHIGWCIIEPKNIEKVLPSLNEIGVSKITFIKCAYSQANFKIKKERLEKILINSSQQCGRSKLMQIEFSNSIENFLQKYPNSYLLDFSDNKIETSLDINTIIVGCEGGLSEDERALFKQEKIVGFNTPLILRSESAVVASASKILL